ncbi:hypothetical protein BH10CYA1_BH10CYA1_09670 [soil metagenome]
MQLDRTPSQNNDLSIERGAAVAASRTMSEEVHADTLRFDPRSQEGASRTDNSRELNSRSTVDSASNVRAERLMSDARIFYAHQDDGNSCSAFAVGMAVSDWRIGRPQAYGRETQHFKELTGTTQHGYRGSLRDMAGQLTREGLTAKAYDYGLGNVGAQALRDLNKELDKGHTAIGKVINPHTGNAHYIYIAGRDNQGNYILGDPDRKNRQHFQPVSGETLIGMMHRRDGFVAVWSDASTAASQVAGSAAYRYAHQQPMQESVTGRGRLRDGATPESTPLRAPESVPGRQSSRATEQNSRLRPEQRSSRTQERDGQVVPGGASDTAMAATKYGAIMDRNSSATDKLSAVRELSHQGISQIRFQGSDGQNYSMRTETQTVGSREMVHLFITLPDGRERVVLRGIARQDGSFEQERNAKGRFVDYYGSGAGVLADRSPGPSRGASDNNDLYQFDGTQRRRGTRYDASADDSRRQSQSDLGANRGGVSDQSVALKEAALSTARSLGSVGYCAKGVQIALAKMGHKEFLGSGNAWDMGTKMAASGTFERVPISEAREGDIVVRSWNRSVIAQHGGRNWGDIVVVTSRDAQGNLNGASDHLERIRPDGGRYENSYALRFKDSSSDQTRQPPQSGSQQYQSLYDRYRRGSDRQGAGGDNVFGSDNGQNQSLNKIMDEAQRSANNAANQLVKTSLGVYMRARMDIDADGSPRARQIDPTGQTRTSWRYSDGSSINAEEVPYMVLPGGQYERFGIKLGDMCLVRNKENGRMAIAVFADVGPRQKRGEGSMALASELGINPSPTRGGVSTPSIEYLVLPNTGYPAQSQQQLLARIKAQGQRLGLR